MTEDEFELQAREPLSEREWCEWMEAELRKGWQDDIYIPRFKFDD